MRSHGSSPVDVTCVNWVREPNDEGPPDLVESSGPSQVHRRFVLDVELRANLSGGFSP